MRRSTQPDHQPAATKFHGTRDILEYRRSVEEFRREVEETGGTFPEIDIDAWNPFAD
jgi:hypothetical protein